MIEFVANYDISGNFKKEEVQLVSIANEDQMAFFSKFDPDNRLYPIIIRCDDGVVFVSIPKPKPQKRD